MMIKILHILYLIQYIKQNILCACFNCIKCALTHFKSH